MNAQAGVSSNPRAYSCRTIDTIDDFDLIEHLIEHIFI